MATGVYSAKQNIETIAIKSGGSGKIRPSRSKCDSELGTGHGATIEQLGESRAFPNDDDTRITKSTASTVSWGC
jgi:hypothetical protein